MKSFVSSLAVLALAASTVSAFTVNSLNNVVVCQPSLITWDGGAPPYYLSVLPAGQPNALALVDLGQQNGTSVTWRVNLGVGVSGFLNLRDSTGAFAQSGAFVVLSGDNDNTTCTLLPVSLSQGSATVAAPASSTGAPVTSGAAAANKTSSTGTAKATGTDAPSSAALSNYAGAGVAALVGSAFIALMI